MASGLKNKKNNQLHSEGTYSLMRPTNNSLIGLLAILDDWKIDRVVTLPWFGKDREKIT